MTEKTIPGMMVLETMKKSSDVASEHPYERATRVVVKCGSTLLTDGKGHIDESYIRELATQITALRNEGMDVVFVSSGAIATGVQTLGLSERPTDIPSLQACASVGQAALIDTYARIFAEQGVVVGQVLLTRNDTASRSSYLHAKNTLERLLELGVLPIVNENDTVAVDEIKFGDNDTLAALTASIAGADLVVLMSDIDGLYTANPHEDPTATFIPRVDKVTDEIMQSAGGAGSKVGVGGMFTKVKAAKFMMLAGVPLVVCLGSTPHILVNAARGEDVGTRFVPPESSSTLHGRKLWIALASKDLGKIVVDKGAVKALREKGSSLLPVGVKEVRGTFERGSSVLVVDEDGEVIGRGLSAYSSEEADVTRGMTLDMVGRIYRDLESYPLIHRDELVVF